MKEVEVEMEMHLILRFCRLMAAWEMSWGTWIGWGVLIGRREAGLDFDFFSLWGVGLGRLGREVGGY